MSTRSAYQPWCSSQPSGEPAGRDGSRSTIATTAMKIVGEEDDEPREDERVHDPGNEALEELSLPEDDGGFVPTRTGRSDERLTGFPERTNRVRKSARRAKTPPAIATATTSATAEPTLAVVLSFLRLPELRRDRRYDLVQVADDRVVGAGQDRGLGVGVHGEDRLRPLAPGHVLCRARDAARDVDVRSDLRPGLADLVRVRSPAGHGDCA